MTSIHVCLSAFRYLVRILVVIQLMIFELKVLLHTIAKFSSEGSYSWVVPSDVTVLQVTLQGASRGNCPTAIGGLGAVVSATLSVSPGSKLLINVGEQGN